MALIASEACLEGSAALAPGQCSAHGCCVGEDCGRETGTPQISGEAHPVVELQGLLCIAMGAAQPDQGGAQPIIWPVPDILQVRGSGQAVPHAGCCKTSDQQKVMHHTPGAILGRAGPFAKWSQIALSWQAACPAHD